MITSERREAMRALLARAEIGADLMERGGLLSFAKMSRIIASEAKDALDALDEMEQIVAQTMEEISPHVKTSPAIKRGPGDLPHLAAALASAARQGIESVTALRLATEELDKIKRERDEAIDTLEPWDSEQTGTISERITRAMREVASDAQDEG